MRLRELTSETGASNNTNNSYGSTTTTSSIAATVPHNFGTSTTMKFRVRAKVSTATSAWATYVS